MLQSLKQDYQDSNVLFIEQDVDAPLGNRLNRWFAGYGSPGTVYLPLVMVDSGNRVSNGQEDFETVYSLMVDSSLQRPTTAAMTVDTEQIGDALRFDVRLTNSSGTTLSTANAARLNALVYEEPVSPASVPIVIAAGSTPITTLDDGATGDYTFEVTVADADWDSVRWVVIADYQPIGTSNPWDTLQAVMGP